MDSSTARIDSMEPEKGMIKISKSYPLEFYYVKATFLEKQYRQCISTCRQILQTEREDQQPKHPLEQTFMRFYLALAHDELARSMHNFSSMKLSAFTQADSLYREAAAVIPTTEQCRQLPNLHNSSFKEDTYQVKAPLPQSESLSTLNSEVFRRAPSPSPFLSPPTQPHTSLPNIISPDASDSELDDLESHDSFGEIVTPQRLTRLPSTFSSMSLLEPQKQAHGLLRPVRPGSIAKPYQAPPNFTPSPKQYRSRLPRLNTGSSLASPQDTPPRRSSPVRKQLRSPDEEWSPVGSPTSPVSSLGSAYVDFDDMAVSPLSPSTPVTARFDTFFGDIPEESKSEAHTTDPIAAHMKALHGQIDTHILLLQQEKERTIAAQSDRTAKNNMRKVAPSNAGKGTGGVPHGRSFWLFTPQDMKVLEKQRRIENGRERMWSRPRFDTSRYQGLAERALAEL